MAQKPSNLTRRRVLVGGGVVLAAGAGLAGGSYLRMGSAEDYARAMRDLRAPLGAGGDMRELVRFATLAANGHNTQPWRFRLEQGRIAITPDFTRRTPVVDPDDHHLFVSLGCAAENLALAAAARGLPGEFVHSPEDGPLTYAYTSGEARPSALCEAIPTRQSTRAPFNGGIATAEHLALLEQAARIDGVNLVLLTERPAIDALRDLVIAANSEQMRDPAFVEELEQWLRFNPRAALDRGDGIPGAASGNPALPSWLGHAIFGLVFTEDAENAKYARQIDTSSGIAVFAGDKADPAHWVKVGRACQRFALQATALGMKLSFINQPVEVARFRPELAALAGMEGLRPDIVLRFGYGVKMPMSPRRPVEAVIEL